MSKTFTITPYDGEELSLGFRTETGSAQSFCAKACFLSIVSFQSGTGAFGLQLKREDLRRRFVKAETTLFKVRYDQEISGERESFLNSRDFNWIAVSSF